MLTPLKATTEKSFFWGLMFFSLVLHGLYFNRGWMSMDEGYFAAPVFAMQTGAMPHLDFQINHPGLIYYWHWLLFQLFGTSILATRIGLWGVCVVQTALWYRIARALLPFPFAVITVLILLVTGPVGFFGSNPNWLGFFLLTVSLWLQFRWLQAPKKRFLLMSGVALGLTLMMKQSLGVFGIFASSLGLLFAQQMEALPSSEAPFSVPENQPPCWQRFLWIAPWILGLGILSTIIKYHPDLWWTHLLLFQIPLLLFMGALFGMTRFQSRHAFGKLFPWKPLLVLGVGVLLPCLVAFAFIGFTRGVAAIGVILQDIFVTVPALVTHSFNLFLPGFYFQQNILFYSELLLVSLIAWYYPLIFGALLVGLLLPAFFHQDFSYDFYWKSLMLLRLLAEWLAPLFFILAFQGGPFGQFVKAQLQVRQVNRPWLSGFFLLSSYAACTYWVTYPANLLNYQLYGLSFAWLSLAALAWLLVPWEKLKQHQRWLVIALPSLLFLGGLCLICGKYTYPWINPFQDHRFSLSKTNPEILVLKHHADTYQQVVSAIQRYSKKPDDLLVLPDNPEIYFLAKKRNPTPLYLIYPEQYGSLRAKIATVIASPQISVIVFPNIQQAHTGCPSFYKAMNTPPALLEDLYLMIQTHHYKVVEKNVCFTVFVAAHDPSHPN